MAFTGNYITDTFLLGMMNGTIKLDGSHTFKIALYTNSASLTSATTAYSATNEVSGSGYSAGGATLTLTAAAITGHVGIIDFNDPTWSAALTARGALIYDSTATNAACFVLDFGMDIVSTTTFTVQFPTADSSNAILRMSVLAA